MTMREIQPRDFPPHALETMQRIAAQYGRLGATRLYRPNLTAAIAATSDSNPIPCRFRRDGTVIGIYGSTLGATAAEAAGTEVRIQISGQEDLFTDGDSAAFVAYRALFGDAQNWFPLNRRVYTGQDWTTTWRNKTVGAITAQIVYAVLEDKVEA